MNLQGKPLCHLPLLLSKILTTNNANTIPSEDKLLAVMIPYLIQVCFYFNNGSFLLLIMQPLLFIPQLHQLPQTYISEKTLTLRNMT